MRIDWFSHDDKLFFYIFIVFSQKTIGLYQSANIFMRLKSGDIEYVGSLNFILMRNDFSCLIFCHWNVVFAPAQINAFHIVWIKTVMLYHFRFGGFRVHNSDGHLSMKILQDKIKNETGKNKGCWSGYVPRAMHGNDYFFCRCK